MVHIIFRGTKIQKGDRIKIPPAIMETLGIKAGKKIIIKFDPIKKEIIICEDKNNNLKKKK